MRSSIYTARSPRVGRSSLIERLHKFVTCNDGLDLKDTHKKARCWMRAS